MCVLLTDVTDRLTAWQVREFSTGAEEYAPSSLRLILAMNDV
jgi:hypothetical protein